MSKGYKLVKMEIYNTSEEFSEGIKKAMGEDSNYIVEYNIEQKCIYYIKELVKEEHAE